MLKKRSSLTSETSRDEISKDYRNNHWGVFIRGSNLNRVLELLCIQFVIVFISNRTKRDIGIITSGNIEAMSA